VVDIKQSYENSLAKKNQKQNSSSKLDQNEFMSILFVLRFEVFDFIDFTIP